MPSGLMHSFGHLNFYLERAILYGDELNDALIYFSENKPSDSLVHIFIPQSSQLNPLEYARELRVLHDLPEDHPINVWHASEVLINQLKHTHRLVH